MPRRLHPLTIESKLLGREGIGGGSPGLKKQAVPEFNEKGVNVYG